MKNKLLCVIQNLLPYEYTLTESTRLSDELGFNSLKMVELIFEIERNFGIEFDDSDLSITNIETIGDIAMLLEKYMR